MQRFSCISNFLTNDRYSGEEVDVPNQTCSYWESNWWSWSEEVSWDEEDDKCSLIPTRAVVVFICPYNEYLDLSPLLLAPHVGKFNSLFFFNIVVMNWQISSIYSTFLTSIMANSINWFTRMYYWRWQFCLKDLLMLKIIPHSVCAPIGTCLSYAAALVNRTPYLVW